VIARACVAVMLAAAAAAPMLLGGCANGAPRQMVQPHCVIFCWARSHLSTTDDHSGQDESHPRANSPGAPP